jgi:hypothetical protein
MRSDEKLNLLKQREIFNPKIGLDIDEVLADWVGHWIKHWGIEYRPKFWNFDRKIVDKFKSLEFNKEFCLSIPRKIDPDEIPFEPHCYITSRSVPVEWTELWLDMNGFACSKVYSVGLGQSKLEAAKESGIDLFVDDSFKTFAELNNNGIYTYLMDAPHNRRYDVGNRRIKHLGEIFA